jgi:hypothetical protein
MKIAHKSPQAGRLSHGSSQIAKDKPACLDHLRVDTTLDGVWPLTGYAE